MLTALVEEIEVSICATSAGILKIQDVEGVALQASSPTLKHTVGNFDRFKKSLVYKIDLEVIETEFLWVCHSNSVVDVNSVEWLGVLITDVDQEVSVQLVQQRVCLEESSSSFMF